MYLQVYRPGDTIEGLLEFTLTRSEAIKCIGVNFISKAHVWRGVGLKRDEKYAEESKTLWTNPKSQSNGKISPRSFNFEFEFRIPSDVPSSFKCRKRFFYGCISCKVVGYVTTSAKRPGRKSVLLVPVQRPVSCNEANPCEAIHIREVRTGLVSGLCYSAGNVEHITKLDRTGYCVSNGDIIPLCVDVQNNSTKRIRMKACIVQRVILKVSNHENVITKAVTSISSEPINPGASTTWKPNMIVPRLPPTSTGTPSECGFITVEYVLEIKPFLPLLSVTGDQYCSIPIVLGNLPYDKMDNSATAVPAHDARPEEEEPYGANTDEEALIIMHKMSNTAL